jgi:hypothetical protein
MWASWHGDKGNTIEGASGHVGTLARGDKLRGHVGKVTRGQGVFGACVIILI